MKTPEELAEEYGDRINDTHLVTAACEKAFIAGYKAAQEHSHAALEEAEARIQKLRDQLMEESGGRLKLFKDDADAKAAYQEALEEVDLDKAWQQGYKTAATEYQEKLNQMRLERPAFKKHEIENLLSQSNADGYKRGYERGLTAQKCWISVKDRLPNDHKHYIVVSNAEIVEAPVWYNGCQSWQMELAYYSQRYERWMKGNPTLKDVPENKIPFEVTHWQELPEPPKEDE